MPRVTIPLLAAVLGLTGMADALAPLPRGAQKNASEAPSSRTMLTSSNISLLGGFRTEELGQRYFHGMTFRRKGDGTRTILIAPGGIGDGAVIWEYLVPASLSTGAWSGWQTLSTNRTNFVSTWNGRMIWRFVRPGNETGFNGQFRSIYWDHADNRLYGTVGRGTPDNYYGGANGSEDMYNLVRADLDPATDRITGVAVYSLDGVGAKRTDGCVMGIPQWYAAAYLSGRRLGVGCGGYRSLISYGQVSMGPALRAIDPPSGAHLSKVPSSEVIVYRDNSGHYATRQGTGNFAYTADSSVGGRNNNTWQWSDSLIQGCVWLDTGSKHGFLCVVLLGTGKIRYHQSGSFSENARLAFHLYNPMDFAPASRRGPQSPRPTEMWEGTEAEWFPGRVAAGNGFDIALGIPDVAYDPVDNRLYIMLAAPGPSNDGVSMKTMYVYQVN